jgi:hypothetical protein
VEARGRGGLGRPPPPPPPHACSVTWDDAQASALGTAPVATFWVALEQNGPWGARAAEQSHLDPDLGETLDRRCRDAGGRFILIRRPGSHPDQHNGDPDKVGTQRVYLAGGLAGLPWLLEADLDDPGCLTRLAQPEMKALANGDIGALRHALPGAEPSAGPILMICTNTRRDLCCSVRGRPVAVESASRRPGAVWECSHTGGHRFAPTGVLLPSGQTFGRLTATSAVAAVDAALTGNVPAQLLGAGYDRGRSHLSAPGQAAESVVRQQIQEPSLTALSTTATVRPDQENAWQCRVSHVDGRHWDVEAVRSPSGDHLPESCGKEPVPAWEWAVVGVSPDDKGRHDGGRQGILAVEDVSDSGR